MICQSGGAFSRPMSISKTATHKKTTPEKTLLRSMFWDGSFINFICHRDHRDKN